MEEWKIRFDPAIQVFVDSLSDDEQHQVQRRLQHLREFGPSLRSTEWVDHIEKGLWELRARCRRVWLRLFYFRSGSNEFTIVHAFKKKMNKTPRHEIEIALQRMRHWQNG